MSSPLRPGRGWYAFAVALSIVGGCGVVGGGLWRVYDKVSNMPRAVMPGELDLHLDGGSYTIYWEPRSVVDGQAYASTEANVRCRLGGKDGPVELKTGGASVSYSMGSYKGQSMFDADIPRDGDYVLQCRTDDDSKVVMAVGQGIGTTIVLTLVGGIGGFALGVVVFLIVYFRRRKARIAAAGPPEARVVSG